MDERKKTILVTGGAGYIGSHICYLLSQHGYRVVCFDNFSAGHSWAARFGDVEKGDLRDAKAIDAAITKYCPDAVVHMASLILVGESVTDPLKYYDNNFIGAVNLLAVMKKHGVKHMVFSSSAAVYGTPLYAPIDEEHPQNPINSYGYTKHVIEKMLQACDEAPYGLTSVSLRYFNAAGAAPDQGLGEAHDPETHLIPLMIQAAQTGTPIKLFGNDYDTSDGTCVRDYVHVLDLAEAHVKSLDYLFNGGKTTAFNLGLGTGISNLEMVQTFKDVLNIEIPYVFAERRAGDPPVLLSKIEKARDVLTWTPKHELAHILKDAWRWHESRK